MPVKVLKPKPEKPAEQSEASFRLIFESHPVPMWVYDLKTLAFLEVNEAAVEKYGYSREEFLSLTLKDIRPAEDVARLLKDVKQKSPALRHAGEWRHRLKDGRIIDVEISTHAIEFNGREAALVMASDISERKQAEAALRESEERYHSLFDRMMDGIYRSTHAGKFVDVNPAMVRMFGYSSKEEMLEVDIQKELYFAPDERGSHVLDTGQEEIEIYRMRRKDGSEIWVEDHGTYVHDEQGRVTHHEGMLRDITERKHAENSLENTHLELQQSLEREQRLARTDGLTGLHNYRHFFELASREFSAALRYQFPLAILMFDTDYLKHINDTLGHTAGDRMLVLVAQTTAVQVRSMDVLARYGGDEFVVLLPQTSAQQALPIAERIRASVLDMRMETDNGPLGVTLSIGVAELRSEPEDENVERIVQRADQAMYAAKQAGRNRTVIFDSK
jgi:diguanylate cyclase (GGDEF)-like protein/PAS domain S-box-containing protein